MAQQTGSISFEAVGGFSSYASGEYAAKETAAALQTAIEQNAEAITLRAQEIERSMTFVPLKHGREDVWFWYSLPATQWTLLDDGWAHYEYTNSGTSEVSTYIAPKSWGQVIPGEEYTFLIEIKNYSGFSGTGQFMYMQEMDGAQFWGTQVVKANGVVQSTRISYNDIVDGAFTKRFVKLADVDHIGDGTTYDNMCFRYRMYIKPNTTLSIDMRISVYPGDYAGPYNEYLTAASSAQLKVANDEIDLRVEKSGVIAAINASTEAEGGSAVKIQADKVQIDGTAIFTAIEDQLDAAYDAKGAAATVQENLDNLAIGGTNLLGGTANPSNKQVVMNSAGTSTFGDVSNYNDAVTLYSFEDFDGYSNTLKWTTNGTGNRGAGWYTKAGAIKAGERYTFSCKVMSSVATTVHTHTAWRNGSATAGYAGWTSAGTASVAANAWTDYSFTFKPAGSAKLDWEFYVALCFSGNSGGATFRVAHAKLEKGNKATDWTPAPEDIEANAVKRTQRIWWRATESGAPSKLTTWLATSGTGYGNWSLSVPKLTSGTTKYPYLYTAVQTQTVAQQAAGNTCSCSPVLLDETTTVIDGGTIITGSVHANSLDADSVKANIVKTTELDATKITSGDIATERMSANVVKAVKAKVSDLYALVAKIGGFVINATSIFSGTAVTSNADNSIALSTADFTRTVNGTSRAGLRFAIGSKFGVTGDGTLYANGANITSINADNISSGSVSADRIKANVISAVNDGTGTINADKVNVSAIKIGDLDGASTVVSNAANGKSAYDRHTAYRGTCSTAAGTAAKVVTCTGFALATGATVEVYCSTANTANVPTLNVNSTGAKPIWINGAVASASNPCKWLAGDTVTFTYDGTRFRASLPVEGYVTEGTGGGLMVHRKSDATTGVQITDSVEILQGGTSVAEYGATARVGEANGNHVSIDSNAVSIMDGTDTLARFGSSTVIGQPRVADNMVIYLGKDTGSNEGITEIVRWVDDSSLARYLAAIHDRINGNDYVVIGDANGTYPEHGYLSVSLGSHTVEGTGPTGDYAIAEGRNNASSGKASHAEGEGTKASAPWSHAQNVGTIAASNSQTAIGAYNIEDSNGVYAFIIGSGASDTARSNALTVDWNGNLVIAGGITLSTPLADANLPTRGSAGTAGTINATSGATLAVPYVTTDAYGRVTAKGTHTHTIGSLAASAVTSGTFDAARIPSLNASKVNAGTFNAARIPNLNASKINAGTFDSARLPTVPVDKGGTGQTGVEKTTDIAAAMSAASGVTISAAQVATWGKAMQVLITAKATSAKSGTWTVGTMTAGHRPELVTFGTSNLAAIEQCRMSTDGAVSVAGTLAANASVSLTFTYLLA